MGMNPPQPTIFKVARARCYCVLVKRQKRGAWKLHQETCRFCTPKETHWQGLNTMRKYGGWFNFESYQSTHEFYQSDHEKPEYWQPCRECNPK